MGLPILLSLPWGLVLMSLFLLLRLLLTVHKGMIDHALPRLVTCVAIHRTVFAKLFAYTAFPRRSIRSRHRSNDGA